MRRMIVLALTVLLSGCSFSPVKIAPESSYTITQWPQKNVVLGQSQTSKTILITTPVATPGYESSNMIYVMVPYQLRSFANHHWVSSPAQLLLPLLANHMRARGYFKGVVTSPFSGGTTYQLNTQLLVLQQEFLQPQSVVRLTMQATLLSGATGKMIGSRVFEAVVPAKNNNPYGGVLATNKAANQVLSQIAYWTVSSALSG